jgi:hypothetical protein
MIGSIVMSMANRMPTCNVSIPSSQYEGRNYNFELRPRDSSVHKGTLLELWPTGNKASKTAVNLTANQSTYTSKIINPLGVYEYIATFSYEGANDEVKEGTFTVITAPLVPVVKRINPVSAKFRPAGGGVYADWPDYLSLVIDNSDATFIPFSSNSYRVTYFDFQEQIDTIVIRGRDAEFATPVYLKFLTTLDLADIRADYRPFYAFVTKRYKVPLAKGTVTTGSGGCVIGSFRFAEVFGERTDMEKDYLQPGFKG